MRLDPYTSAPGERSREVEERHEVVMDATGKRVQAERWIRRIHVERGSGRYPGDGGAGYAITVVRTCTAILVAAVAALATGTLWNPGAAIPTALIIYGLVLWLVSPRG